MRNLLSPVRRNIGKALAFIILLIFACFYFFPLLWMLLTALKPNDQIFVYPPRLLPAPPKWDNFLLAINAIPFGRYTMNSVIVSSLATLGALISCPLAAYSMSRIRWRGSNALFLITLAVMMIPNQVTMVPQFIIFSKLNLVGTFIPLILPMFFGVPYYIFLMRQFFRQLPKALEDAARIDGCNEFRIYSRIMLPLCQPSLLTIGMFQFIAAWNDFLGPLIYLNSEKTYTLQIGLQQFKQSQYVEWSFLMAVAILVALPIIILYFVVQKSFIQGITFGGIKG